MSHLHRTDPGPAEQDESQPASRSAIADVAGRFANWITGAEPLDDEHPGNGYGPVRDPMRELSVGTATEEPISPRAAAGRPRVTPDRSRPATPAADADGPSRFPVAPLGYSRAAVDEHLAALERELVELRVHRQPSIAGELERLGEQTASILVVAHDQATETTRLAREEAERCVADAAANAVTITAQAKEKLRELDTETDAVWRERERLLEDVRGVSAALASLADRAQERFPADPAQPTVAEPQAAPDPPATLAPEAGLQTMSEPQATQPFSAVELDEAGGAPQRWEAYDASPPDESNEFPRATDSRISGEFPGGWSPRG